MTTKTILLIVAIAAVAVGGSVAAVMVLNNQDSGDDNPMTGIAVYYRGEAVSDYIEVDIQYADTIEKDITVKAVYKNGTEKTVEYGYTTTLKEKKIGATFTSKVTYGNYSLEFEGTIVGNHNTITIENALDRTYDGSESYAVVSCLGGCKYTITWFDEYNLVLTDAPVNAGTYSVIVTTEASSEYLETTLTKSFVISKATPSAPSSVQSFTGTYSESQTLSDFVFNNKDFSWKDGGEVPVCNKTSYTAYYNPDKLNYNNVEINVNVILEKATPVATKITGISGTMGAKLSTVVIECVTWANPDETIKAGTNEYKAYYNPDKDNYEDLEVSISVTSAEFGFTVTYVSGTENCYTINKNSSGEYTIAFGKISEASEYSISGTLSGNIVIDVGDDYEFKLSLDNASINSSNEAPIAALSGDKVTISAKNGTTNTIIDNRKEITDESVYASAIYSIVDLDIQGKGTLNVTSANNNGIHTKDDLHVKNLTLTVICCDNALKGNDSVEISSGNITAIATKGDAIKTTNSELTTKKQKGNVTINTDDGDLVLNVYSSCDGISAAYDVIIEETSGNLTLDISTDKYSTYSEEHTATSTSKIYISSQSNSYTYSMYFYDSTGGIWKNFTYLKSSSEGGGRGPGSTTYYYSCDNSGISSYTNVYIYVYSSSQKQGQGEDYTAMFSGKYNSSFDMVVLEQRGQSDISARWSNYGSVTPGGDPGQGGNTDKSDVSTKGIKACNSITITGGTISIKSYDDAIHANNDTELASGYGTGNVTISGGTLTLYSNDDAIHGDGAVVISGGKVTITYCFEGVEGNTVTISGGTTSITSKDDGVNGTATSGTVITVSGGYLYVYAGGDGLDSNSRDSYSGILFSGGNTVIIATSADNSAIDTENGYKYTGGKVMAMSQGGGMSNENTNCSNFNSVGKSVNLQISSGKYVTFSSFGSFKSPVSMNNANVICLGSTSTTIASSSTSLGTDDENGVYWK